VELACESLGVAARVELIAEVPVGCGFGASGAATLSTVLAADAEWGLGRDREELVDVAARAELAAGTGQSDVYVQEQGGLAWDVGDGRGRRDRTDAVAYVTFGGVETDAVLADEQAMQQVGAAAERTFPRFDPDAQLADLLALSWEFARETGLATDRVRRTVEEVEAAGEAATMAMVGETVVAVGGDLPDADATAAGETRITPDGARTLRG
jgi:pantoate kinase